MPSCLKNPRDGFVLVVVLWVLAALTLVTVSVSRRAFLERRAAAYSLDHTRAMMMARGAVHRGMVEIQNKRAKESHTQSSHLTHLGQQWARPVNLLRESNYFDVPAEEYANDRVEYRITDAAQHINLNMAPEELLSNIPGFEGNAVRRILQRRGEETHAGEGATPFYEIEELRYLEGIDDAVWYGDEDRPGLSEFLTTHGDGRINVNTAPPHVLLSLPRMERGAVDQILAYRAGGDGLLNTVDDRGFNNLADVIQNGGLRGPSVEAIQRFCKFNSSLFCIRGTATLRSGRVRASVTAVVTVTPDMIVVLGWREEPLGT